MVCPFRAPRDRNRSWSGRLVVVEVLEAFRGNEFCLVGEKHAVTDANDPERACLPVSNVQYPECPTRGNLVPSCPNIGPPF
jgi:hypothetical protein